MCLFFPPPCFILGLNVKDKDFNLFLLIMVFSAHLFLSIAATYSNVLFSLQIMPITHATFPIKQVESLLMETDDSTKLNKAETTKDKTACSGGRGRGKKKKRVIHLQIVFMLSMRCAVKLIVQSSIFYTHLLRFTSGVEWIRHAAG